MSAAAPTGPGNTQHVTRDDGVESFVLPPRRASTSEPFVIVPVSWISKAGAAGDSALWVSLVLLYRRKLARETETVLSNQLCREFGIDRKRKARGLRQL